MKILDKIKILWWLLSQSIQFPSDFRVNLQFSSGERGWRVGRECYRMGRRWTHTKGICRKAHPPLPPELAKSVRTFFIAEMTSIQGILNHNIFIFKKSNSCFYNYGFSCTCKGAHCNYINHKNYRRDVLVLVKNYIKIQVHDFFPFSFQLVCITEFFFCNALKPVKLIITREKPTLNVD